MALIIDGHNLIAQLPGISLADPEDEEKLINLLQAYCRVKRKKVEVYFDRAPAGYAGKERHGLVLAIFVPSGTTADEAIMARLKKLGKKARNMKVVSSDRQVQAATRAAHAMVVASDEFVIEWQSIVAEKPDLDPRNKPLTQEEVEAWEDIFENRDSD
jgi:predicted RNA-binding protein with PIN domain